MGIIVSGNNACGCSGSQARRLSLFATMSKFFPRDARARPLEMTKPRGCLRVLTAKLMRLAREGNVEGIRAYVRSDSFLADFTGLDPGRRQSVMRCYAKAATLCEAKRSCIS